MAKVGISGYFLQTDNTSSITYLKFYGRMEKLLALIDTDIYRKYIATHKKGHKIMSV